MRLGLINKQNIDRRLRDFQRQSGQQKVIATDSTGGDKVVNPQDKVTTVNALGGAVTIAAGGNLTLRVAGQTITIEYNEPAPYTPTSYWEPVVSGGEIVFSGGDIVMQEVSL